MRQKVILALLLCFGLGGVCHAQANPLASPYSNSVFKPSILTASGQTGAVIQLNALTTPTSTVGSSFASGTITLTGTSLTTVTFAIQGSADNGATYFPLPIFTVGSPSTPPTTTVTATVNGLYQVSLAGLTHVRFATSGTFTATNVSLTLTASPNTTVSRNNASGGGATTPATVNVYKGNGSVNGVDVAIPGTDYVIPSGTVAAADALASTPTPCTSPQVAGGVDVHGNAINCVTPTGTPPVVAGSSQYANSVSTPNAFVSGGLFNSDSFNTANNGVATAQGLGITNILVPANTTSSEDFYAAITRDNSHLHDERGGFTSDYYLNTNPTTNSSKAQMTWCVDNHAPSGPGVENHNGCHYSLILFSESGMDVTGIPTLYLADEEQANFYGNGIHQGHSTEILCYTDDDCGGEYTYMHVRAANLAGASEGSVLSSKQGFEDGTAFGTIVTGGSHATTIQTSLTNGGLANSSYIIFPSENIGSGTILSYTFAPGGDRTLGFVTTSDTHSISAGYGFLTAACGTNTVANDPQPVTCPFSTSTPGFGTFTSGQLVAIADYQDFECSVATVSGGNITLSLTRTHPANTPIYQGVGTCAKALQGRGASPVYNSTDGFTPSYQVAGARTTTTWDLVFPVKNAQNGQNTIPLYGPITGAITSASQTGTTVTLTLSSSGGAFNHYTAPSGASICVSGNSNAAFNQCGITGITATNSSFTLTYTVASSASITGTGGVINVGTVASPTINGLGNYEIDCGAMVTKILGVTRLFQKGDGSVNLEANNCTMSPSEAFFQPNNPAQFFQGTRVQWTASTPNPGFGANYLNQFLMGGGAWSGGEYIILGTDDQIGSFGGWGGNQLPRIFLDTSNEVGIGTFFQIQSAPIGTVNSGNVGGTFAHIANFKPGGFETQYDLFTLDGDSGSVHLREHVDTNTLQVLGTGATSTFEVENLQVNGTASITGYPTLAANNIWTGDQTIQSGSFTSFTAISSNGFGTTLNLQNLTSGSVWSLDTSGTSFGGATPGSFLFLHNGAPSYIFTDSIAFFPGSLQGTDAEFGAGGFVCTVTNGRCTTPAALTTALAAYGQLGAANTWTAAQTFSGGVEMGGGAPGISTQTASNTDLAGQLTLVAGTASYTFTGTYVSSPICGATDTTATNAAKASATATTLTITGTGTDVINYVCIGRD